MDDTLYSIVIVDDEAETRNGIANYFPWESVGFAVVCTCSGGEDALRYLRANQVDVLVTDIQMPSMNGIEFVSKLREENDAIKIVFLSIHQNFNYARKALDLNVSGYLVKPTKYRDLMEFFTKLKKTLDAQRIPGAQKIAPDRHEDYYDMRLSSIREYVNQNIRDVSLKSTAHFAYMNPSYLCSFFKKYSGMGFYDYVTQQKMKRAAELLRNINSRISDVAQKVGYNNPNSFSRAFKQFYGMTPMEYRNAGAHARDGGLSQKQL